MAVLSLPDAHVTGPVHHYVRTAAGGNVPYYLGTAETTPKVEVTPRYRDAMNDIAGRSLPMQRTFDGVSGMVGTVLTRYSKSAYRVVQNVGSNIAGLQIAPGWEGRFSRGSLVYGSRTFELWLVFENYWNATFRTPGLEPGLYFPQVMLAGDTRDTLGTEIEKLILAFDAQPYWQPQASYSQVSGTERSWMLLSVNETYFPASVQVPQ